MPRKTLAIQVLPEGKVLVKAPVRASDSIISDFLHRNRVWIESTVQKISELAKKNPQKKYRTGEKFLYLGKEYPLRVADDMFGKLLFEDQFILSARQVSRAAILFEKWYKQEAFMVFTQRCQKYASLMSVTYKNLNLSSARSRWGCCTPYGNLRFNWRLVKAPLEIIDYVVVHELAHLKELNHSSRFWMIVQSYFPRYVEAKKWLKENAYFLA